MIERIHTNRHPLDPALSAGQPNHTGALPDKDADVSVQVNYADLIEKALKQPQTDTQRVERARDLLICGELDTPDNTWKAAENMVKFGF